MAASISMSSGSELISTSGGYLAACSSWKIVFVAQVTCGTRHFFRLSPGNLPMLLL